MPFAFLSSLRGKIVAMVGLLVLLGLAGLSATKVITARFYAETILPQAAGLAQTIRLAGATINRMGIEMF